MGIFGAPLLLRQTRFGAGVGRNVERELHLPVALDIVRRVAGVGCSDRPDTGSSQNWEALTTGGLPSNFPLSQPRQGHYKSHFGDSTHLLFGPSR